MKQLLWMLFVGFLTGSWWRSLQLVQCSNSAREIYKTSCYDTKFGRTCLTTPLINGHNPVRTSFENASDWCKTKVPGSSLIVINNEVDQRIVQNFTYVQSIENVMVFTDARKLSTNESRKWSWVNGHQIIPNEVIDRAERFPDATGVELNIQQQLPAYLLYNVSSLFHYICEYSDSKLIFTYRQNNKSYVTSEGRATWYEARKECLRSGGDLLSIMDNGTIEDWSWLIEHQRYWIGLHRNKWIWTSTDVAITYTNWETGYPDENPAKQCICIRPLCRRENYEQICDVGYDRKWWTCSCDNRYPVVCQKEEVNSDAATEEMLPTISADFKSSISLPSTFKSYRRTSSSISRAITSTSTKRKTTERTTLKPIANSINSIPLPKTTKTTITTTTIIKSTITTTPTTTAITTTTTPIKSAFPTVTTYAMTTTARGTFRKTAPSSSLTKKPSSHFSDDQTTAFASSSSSPSTGLYNTKEILLIPLLFVAVVFIIVAVVLIIRKRKNDRRNEGSPTRNTKQSETVSSAYATVAPVNRPSEGTIPPGNTIYAEVEMTPRSMPFNNTNNASVKPTSDFSVIYAEPNKPTKSSTPTGKAFKAADPIYLEAIEVKPGAGSADVATQDPSAVYAEPIKVKKLS